LQFVVDLQAFFTLLGNITVAIAAWRIAISNGWTLRELNPLPRSRVGPGDVVIDGLAATPYAVVRTTETDLQLAGKLLALTVGCSYLLKYGELALDLPLSENGAAAAAIVFGIPAVTGYLYYRRGLEEGGEGFSLPSFGGGGSEGGGGLSMADVKKFGVSGTVAYVLTELAFWAVAFPVASTALYLPGGVDRAVSDHGTLAGRNQRRRRPHGGVGVHLHGGQHREAAGAIATRGRVGVGSVGG
jgi:hypothetical protein